MENKLTDEQIINQIISLLKGKTVKEAKEITLNTLKKIKETSTVVTH